MRVGIWHTAAEAQARPQKNGSTKFTWDVDLPEGWNEATGTLGFTAADLVAGLKGVALALSGCKGTPLAALAPRDSAGPLTAWTAWQTVPPGRYTLTLTLPVGSALSGVWLSNGHLPHGWPGLPPALAVDEYLLPGKVRPIPTLPAANTPLEYAERGLATHLNQQGAMGVADGILTAVPRSLRLRYVDAELHIMLHTKTGLQRPKYICPDYTLGLLDNFLLCPVARFTYDEVAYTVTFAAVPEGDQAADAILVEAKNLSRRPKPNRLVVLLDAAAGAAIDHHQIIAGGETLAYFGPTTRARIAHRAIGCADLTATTAGDMYSTPFLPSWGQGRNPKYHLAFYSGRIAWDGKSVRYRLACPPNAAYTIYLGVFSTTWGGPGQKVIYAGDKVVWLGVDGAPEKVKVDATNLIEPAVVRFDAADHDGDGQIEMVSDPDPDTLQAIGFLNAIWVFPAGTEVDLDALRLGSLNDTALHFVNVGGSLPGGVVDLVITEDHSFTYVEFTGAAKLAPGAVDSFHITLPVAHRADQLPYSQARYWREAGEDTAAYAARLALRHAAAQFAVSQPAAALARVRAYWAAQMQSSAHYHVPDDATQSIVDSSVCYFIAHRVKLAEGQYLPIGGGPMYYFDFSERDCGYEIVSFDIMGRHAETELLLNPYLTGMDELKNPRWALGQDEHGMWMTRAHEEDTQGQVLWALGEHFMLTHDLVWLARAWPRIKAGLEYIRTKRAEQKAEFPDPADPRHGLWISGTDESKAWGKMSHSYYFSYWIECGLRLGVLEAEAMGETDYAQTLRAEHTDFVACLHRSLAQTFWRIDYRRGALPNTAEEPDSTNPWGVQESLWPSQSVSPWDPMVAQTIAYCDALAYPRVGGLTLGPRMLWPSAACDFAMMHLRRGEGDRVVDIFNSMITTCGEVNTWGETIYFTNGLTTGEQPYMWANACFMILMRQMLFHESGEWLAGGASGPHELWLAPATPRKWLDDPAGFGVENVPSYFGPLSFHSRLDKAQRTVTTTLKLAEGRRPERLVVHVRTSLGTELTRVTVNGVEHPYYSGEKVVIANPPADIEIVAWL